MKRYQMYLSPGSLSVIDQFGRLADLPKSKVIRESIERVAVGLVDYISQILIDNKGIPERYSSLNKLRGIIKSEKKKTSYALSVDDIVYTRENL